MVDSQLSPSDVPALDHFETFHGWLQALVKKHGMQRKLARAAQVEPQAVTKWLKGGGIETPKLRLIANYTGLNYRDLRDLVDGNRGVREDSLGYEPLKSATAQWVCNRWDTLPPAIQSFLLAQIKTYDDVARGNPALAKIMFSPPAKAGYPNYERELVQWDRRLRKKHSESQS